MDAENKTSPTSHSNSPAKYEIGSVRRALSDRMTLSEAIETVGVLISRFPNGGQAASGRGYIGGLAAVLLEYPRIVAAGAPDPVRGVPSTTKFLPTPADVIAWCERAKADMARPVEIEDHDARLRRERQERASEGEYWQKARVARPSGDDLKAKHGENWGIRATDASRGPDLAIRQVERANAVTFARECEAAGMPANSVVSPSLARQLGDWRVTRETSEAAE